MSKVRSFSEMFAQGYGGTANSTESLATTLQNKREGKSETITSSATFPVQKSGNKKGEAKSTTNEGSWSLGTTVAPWATIPKINNKITELQQKLDKAKKEKKEKEKAKKAEEALLSKNKDILNEYENALDSAKAMPKTVYYEVPERYDYTGTYTSNKFYYSPSDSPLYGTQGWKLQAYDNPVRAKSIAEGEARIKDQQGKISQNNRI